MGKVKQRTCGVIWLIWYKNPRLKTDDAFEAIGLLPTACNSTVSRQIFLYLRLTRSRDWVGLHQPRSAFCLPRLFLHDLSVYLDIAMVWINYDLLTMAKHISKSRHSRERLNINSNVNEWYLTLWATFFQRNVIHCFKDLSKISMKRDQTKS